MSHPKVSIIIPAFNEGARIGGTLQSVVNCIERQHWDAEVIVVDDGSSDDTASIVETWKQRFPRLRIIQNVENRGKGYSIRNGVFHSDGDIVMFTDADLSAPIIEAEKLFRAIADGADVAIGSRWIERARQAIKQPLYRRFFGRCFNGLTRTVMGLPYKDTQCGFKAFTREAAQVIFRLQTIERWGFDPELLFIARSLDLKIVEVPVTWGHDDRSRINYLRDGSRMLAEMSTIRFNASAGRYRRSIASITAPVGSPARSECLPEPKLRTQPY